MSSFDRRAILSLLSLGPLAACGMTPVYGTGAPANALVDRTRMADPRSEDTFDLTRQLERRLGRASDPVFELAVRPRVRQTSLAVTGSGSLDITRYNLIGVASYRLKDIGSGETVVQGEVDTFTSYSASGSTASTVAARRDARNRLMIALADLTVTELNAKADQLPQ